MSTQAKYDLSRFSGYFSKPIEERRRLLLPQTEDIQQNEELEKLNQLLEHGGLTTAIGDKMIENFVGILGMPVRIFYCTPRPSAYLLLALTLASNQSDAPPRGLCPDWVFTA